MTILKKSCINILKKSKICVCFVAFFLTFWDFLAFVFSNLSGSPVIVII